MMTTLPRRVTPAEKTLFQDLEDESILLDLESEYYFSLDDVGTRIWQLLSEHPDTETVLALMLDEYDVDEATLRQDMAVLIEKLVDAGLVTVTE